MRDESRFSTGLIVGRFRPAAPRPLVHDRVGCTNVVSSWWCIVNSSTSAGHVPRVNFARGGWPNCILPCDVREVRHQLWRPTGTMRNSGLDGWPCSARSGRTQAGPHVVFSSDAYVSRDRSPVRRSSQSSSMPTASRCRSARHRSATTPADHLDRLAPPRSSAWVEANWGLISGSAVWSRGGRASRVPIQRGKVRWPRRQTMRGR